MSRITTIHGVQIPPKRHKKGRGPGCKHVTIDFVLTGTVPSKKNRSIPTIPWNKLLKVMFTKFPGYMKGSVSKKELITALVACKPFIRYSEKFMAWETAAKQTIEDQAQVWIKRLQEKGHDVVYPIGDASVSIYHYWKDNNTRDNSNKSETIHDILKGIIVDDTWQNLTPIKADANLYEGEILNHITVIKVTAYNWIL